jgi:hypothetical protein
MTPFRTIPALLLLTVVLLAAGCIGLNTFLESDGSCPYHDYQPVLLIGDNVTTRFLGHETKTLLPDRARCTKFDSSYSVGVNFIPPGVKKFDFVEFDQERILTMIQRNQQIDVLIRGEKYNATLKQMWPDAEDIGIYSYSGSFDGTYWNKTILTVSNRTTTGSVTWAGETFYISPVGSRIDASGNFSPVCIIYSQRDLEGPRIDLSNDVLTHPTTRTP